MSLVLKHYLISGRVQGVGYRAFTHRTAVKMGLLGWVRNLADRRVEVLVKATSENLKEFEGHLQRGPSQALVESIESEIVNQDFVWHDFQIKPDGEKPWPHS